MNIVIINYIHYNSTYEHCNLKLYILRLNIVSLNYIYYN